MPFASLILGAVPATTLAQHAWQPRFRDESLIEWLIVVCYFATALLCIRARRVTLIGLNRSFVFQHRDRRGGDRSGAYLACARFWALLGALFIFLGINKQLDIQTALTSFARGLSRDMGWYDHRRLFQLAIVGAVALAGLGTFLVLLGLARRLMPRLVLAFAGTVLLAVFLLTKASSYHHLDAAMRVEILGVRVYQPLELAGILCVTLCALINCWWHDFRSLFVRFSERVASA